MDGRQPTGSLSARRAAESCTNGSLTPSSVIVAHPAPLLGRQARLAPGPAQRPSRVGTGQVAPFTAAAPSRIRTARASSAISRTISPAGCTRRTSPTPWPAYSAIASTSPAASGRGTSDP